MVFPSIFWIQKFKVVVFPSIFWNITIIWQFFKVILNFAQKCYYLKNKVGAVDFTKARGLVKYQNPRALKHYQSLGHLQNLLRPLYFWGNVSNGPPKNPGSPGCSIRYGFWYFFNIFKKSKSLVNCKNNWLFYKKIDNLHLFVKKKKGYLVI